MSSKQFREFNNFFYIATIIIASISISNPKLINLLSLPLIGIGITYIFCSYYNLIKMTSFKIGRFILAITGLLLTFIGFAWLLAEIYTILFRIL